MARFFDPLKDVGAIVFTMTSPQKHFPIVITGASGGIGNALLHASITKGYRVIAVLKNEMARAEIESGLEKKYQNLLSFEYADLSNPDEVETLAGKILSISPSIEWLIHCAGHINTNDLSGVPTQEELNASFSVNTFAPILLSLRLKDSIAIGGGIIFISSTAGLWGSDKSPIYAASKSALHGFALSMQKILGEKRRSIVVAPGPTNTPMREAFAHDAAMHQSPEIVAQLILEEIVSKANENEQNIFVIRKGAAEKIAIEVCAS